MRFFELGFEVPELQVTFAGAGGHEADLDFWWPSVRKGGEFDGKHKYTRGAILRPGQDPGEVVFQEKLREDALRPQMNSFTRWVWAHAANELLFLRHSREHGVPAAASA